MSATASPSQIQALQATRRQAGISNEDWADRLERTAGVRSTKLLSVADAGRLLDELRGAGAASAARLGGPYGAIVRALWISGWQLGVIEDRRDAAMTAWVERQTGMAALSWVRSPAQGRATVEALKAWLARDGGVDWTERPNEPKAAVVMSIFNRLSDLGVWEWDRGLSRWHQIERYAAKFGLTAPSREWTSADWATVAGRASNWLRRTIAKRAAEDAAEARAS